MVSHPRASQFSDPGPLVHVPNLFQDNNIFAITAEVRRALRKAGYAREADRLCERVSDSESWDDAVTICLEYAYPFTVGVEG